MGVNGDIAQIYNDYQNISMYLRYNANCDMYHKPYEVAIMIPHKYKKCETSYKK